MRSPHLFVATALAAVALSAPAVVTAAEPVAVKYSDLDLGTADGQARLERRIDSAARTACGMDQVRTGRFTATTAARQCYEQTKAAVHEQVAALIARDNRGG